jgi:hypothetical protein
MASTGRRFRRWVTLVVVLIASGAALDWMWAASRRSRQPTNSASWIWAPNTNRWTGPQGFLLARDFHLETVPEEVSLVVQGDAEYILFLNGARIGSGSYQVGAVPDRYDVGRWMRAGRNRITAQLRSPNGFGGFLLALYVDGQSTPLVVSDENWIPLRRFIKKRLRPLMALDRPARAVELADPPEGRWGATTETTLKPLHSEVLRGRSLRARRLLVPDEPWRRLRRRGRPGRKSFGELVLLDWGRPVSGYLVLGFRGEVPSLGLVYLGMDRPDVVLSAPDILAVGTPGQDYWEDVVPRRFRYAMLVGLDNVHDARVVLTDSRQLAAQLGGHPPNGVLGQPAPRLRSAAEDKVWSKLEGFARFPRRQRR